MIGELLNYVVAEGSDQCGCQLGLRTLKTCVPIWLRHWQECKQLHTKKPAQCGLRVFLSVDLPAVAVPEADPILNRLDQDYLDTRTPLGVPVPFANQVKPKPMSHCAGHTQWTTSHRILAAGSWRKP
ncbi:hypothetical protein WKQ99_12660 [Pseudomonas atacamensis]|uniref:hypothetical protein n=1 Tax=Pseudomonas TaxID=286 RepID=UPI00296E9E4B